MDFVNSRRIMSNEKTFAAADGLSVLSANFFRLIKAENSNNDKGLFLPPKAQNRRTKTSGRLPCTAEFLFFYGGAGRLIYRKARGTSPNTALPTASS